MRKCVLSSSGITFIEAIMLMVIIGACGVGLMGGIMVTNQQMQDGRSTAVASVLAQERIDTIVADKMYLGYNYLAANNYPAEVLAAPFDGFTRQTTITEVSAADLTTPQAESGIKRIAIDVIWGNLPQERLQLMTLLTSYL